ncbi:MAG: hypothetical protein LKK22_00405 [Olsenella sp.]|jgi:hypothetical protein|nr:hypothetical protein [Olsenella sp.]
MLMDDGKTIEVAQDLDSTVNSCANAQAELCSDQPEKQDISSTGEALDKFVAQAERLLDVYSTFAAQVGRDVDSLRSAVQTLRDADADAAASLSGGSGSEG